MEGAGGEGAPPPAKRAKAAVGERLAAMPAGGYDAEPEDLTRFLC
jgi:hypothetical protein